MKRFFSLLFLFAVFFPSAFSLVNMNAAQTFSYQTSEDASAFIGGLAADSGNQLLFVGIRLQKPKAHPERVDIRLLAVNLVTGEIEDSVDVPRENFRSISQNESWSLQDIVRTPDGRLFGLFGKRVLSPQWIMATEALESAVFELPAPSTWKTSQSVKRLSLSSNTVHHGLIFFNGNLYTATKKNETIADKKELLPKTRWGLTRIDLSSGEEKFFENDGEFHHVWQLSVSPNGTVVADRFELGKDNYKSLLVYQLQPDRLKLLQKIEYNPLKLGLPFVGGPISLLAQDDFFVVGTTADFLETYRKKGDQFVLQPEERVSIENAGESIYGIIDLALAENRLVSAQSFNENKKAAFVAVPLDAGPAIVQNPLPETVSLAAKAAAVEQSVLPEQPLALLDKTPKELLVQISFDPILAERIEEKNNAEKAFVVFANNAKVFVDGMKIPRGKDGFLVLNQDGKNFFYIEKLGPVPENGKKEVLITSKIPGFSGEGVSIRIDPLQQPFLDESPTVFVSIPNESDAIAMANPLGSGNP